MFANAAGPALGADRQVAILEGGSLLLPSGRRLYYPGLQLKQDQYGQATYEYGTGRGKSFINGHRLCENIVQAIARDVLAEQALIVQAKTGSTPVLMVHDELVYVVPEADAEAFLATVNAAMRTAPKWSPKLILWSEGAIGDSYGDAK
jgi:DNA polymerase